MNEAAYRHFANIVRRWPDRDIEVVSERDHAVSAIVDGELFVRSGDEAGRIGEVWGYLSEGGVNVPELVEVADSLLVARVVRGGDDPVRAGGLGGLGRQVAQLHSLAVPDSWRDRGWRASRWDRKFGEELAARAETGVARSLLGWQKAIESELAASEADGMASCVHGDLFANNALAIGEGRVVLVDFESAGYGSALSDLGHVVADLAIRCQLGVLSREEVVRAWAAFCQGYGAIVAAEETRWRNPYLRTVPWLALGGGRSAHLSARLRTWLGVEGDLVALADTLAEKNPDERPW